MADLDTLRPEVRESLERLSDSISDAAYVAPENENGDRTALQAIRAELLRLATQVEFRDRQVLEIRKMLSTFNTHGDDRIQWDVNDAVQEVGVLREAIQAYENDAIAYRDRIINLEAELAALKARVAEAPIGMVVGGAEGNLDNTDSYRVDVTVGWESSLADKRVRLMVVEE